MNRQEYQPKNQLACHQLKRVRPNSSDTLMSMPQLMPATLNLSPNIALSPFIHGFQDHLTSSMSSLIRQQDGCVRLVAHQSNSGRQRQEQLEHTIAMKTPKN